MKTERIILNDKSYENQWGVSNECETFFYWMTPRKFLGIVFKKGYYIEIPVDFLFQWLNFYIKVVKNDIENCEKDTDEERKYSILKNKQRLKNAEKVLKSQEEYIDSIERVKQKAIKYYGKKNKLNKKKTRSK